MKFKTLITFLCAVTTLVIGDTVRDRCSNRRLEDNKLIVEQYQREVQYDGDYAPIYDKFADNICVDVPGQDIVCGKDRVIPIYAANALGGLGNYQTINPTSE